ncbi:MAG: enoyl-CoA hydratase [Rhodospirillales bacterium]
MPTDKILAEKEGAVGRIVFNNPERHNAVSLEMWEGVTEALDTFEKDDEVRVIVVTGAGGKSFVSGADISKFEDERSSQEAIKHYDEVGRRAYFGLYNCPKPTIAMIRGYCIGGGVAVAICCDLRICTKESSFGIPAAKLGLGYAFDKVRQLSDLVGPAFAKEIFFTGKRFTAEQAAEMGLVNRVVSDNELEGFVQDYAETIAGNAPLTVASIKKIANEIVKDPDARDIAACDAMVKACFDSQDYIEGRRAFMEKRKPDFTGK